MKKYSKINNYKLLKIIMIIVIILIVGGIYFWQKSNNSISILTPPENVKAIRISSDKVKVEWDWQEGALAYHIFRNCTKREEFSDNLKTALVGSKDGKIEKNSPYVDDNKEDSNCFYSISSFNELGEESKRSIAVKVYESKSEPKQGNKLTRSCESNTDCREYISYNTCELFCLNTNDSNKDVISRLKETCDATSWDRPSSFPCECVNNLCQYIR